MIKIECSEVEKTLLKRNIRATGHCIVCVYKPQCQKPPDMTCGEYINGMIKWEVVDENIKIINKDISV